VKLNRESGITIILVTHEPDIAAFSRRIIKFRDGIVVSDDPVPAGGRVRRMIRGAGLSKNG